MAKIRKKRRRNDPTVVSKIEFLSCTHNGIKSGELLNNLIDDLSSFSYSIRSSKSQSGVESYAQNTKH
jgi:hypothetical protein